MHTRFHSRIKSSVAVAERSKSILLPIVCVVAGVASQPADAALSQTVITAPGGFISAYAGLSNGANNAAGSNIETDYFASDLVLNEQTFTSGTATAAANYSINTASNYGSTSATGYVTFGALGYSATNVRDNHTSTQGTVNGGWTDSILFSDPALNGQSGTWMFTLDVSGLLEASGFSGSSFFQVANYVNGNFGQYDFWQVMTAGAQENNTMTVNESVAFSVPFTWGTAFDLGIYAVGKAGWRSGSAVPGTSTSDLDFMNTVLWGGTSCVLVNGGCVTGYSIISGSGINWDLAYSAVVPLPSAVWLFGSGFLGVVGVARRMRG